ncbi:hypothetical protein HAX54_024592 [Datura stramonium]|uniref:Heat shock protein 90 n=1 Tax=Datura stramonium TaxID=4076 RepID=A0ABS8V011_DATST|nr:hypothetical protein [Datura stramonium]
MHRLSKRSLNAILRSTSAARYRDVAAPISSSHFFYESADADSKGIWYSTLTSGRCNVTESIKPFKSRNEPFLGCRYESTAAASDAADSPSEKFEYQAEVSRLMDLIVNSLYSNKEVFLRELISNASDALDKLRFLGVTEPELLKDAVDLDIRIQTDKDNGIITITSGTAKFLRLKDSKDAFSADSNLIGQFGVGFYSAFLVSERVEVSTKSPKSEKQYVWVGEANSSTYTIRKRLILQNTFLGEPVSLYILRLFVSFPIYTWQEKGYTKEVEVDEDPAEAKKEGEDETAEKKKKTKKLWRNIGLQELTNETQPIWVAQLVLSPAAMLPKEKLSSVCSFCAICISMVPTLPEFYQSVVDSNDLPLNVSTRDSSKSRIVRIMRKRLVRKAFEMIQGIASDYEKFWENFGKHLKLGCIEDRRKPDVLLHFTIFSSQSEHEMISLDEYVENMKPDQKDIYYIASDSVTSAKNTPFLEKLLEKDLEEKNFIDISKEDLDLGDKNEDKEKEIKQFRQTCDWIKKRLGTRLASVQISNRLSSSPCVLVSGKFGWSANMERLMKAQTVGDTSSLEFMRSRRVFEINPEHPIEACRSTQMMRSLEAIDLLYDAALVSSGFTPENPAQLGREDMI